jgi:hypothetical protein
MPLARDDAPQPARESAADAVAYVPRALVESVFRHPERVSPWHERLDGTLLMGDVSGFTAMSELLARAGNEGAEWLTESSTASSAPCSGSRAGSVAIR